MIREVIEFTPEIYQKIVARTNGATFSESVLTLVQVGLDAIERVAAVCGKIKSMRVSFLDEAEKYREIEERR